MASLMTSLIQLEFRKIIYTYESWAMTHFHLLHFPLFMELVYFENQSFANMTSIGFKMFTLRSKFIHVGLKMKKKNKI